ncbi:MAG: hypothetical protein M9894_12350 [Planctomycetes bacterium]|nr:hypothetical protein [Planctomycetota bacterium]
MIEPDAPFLSFDQLRSRLLQAVVDAGLRPYAVKTLLNMDDLSRELSFCVVPRGWAEPFRHRAQVEIVYDVTHAAAASDPEGRSTDPDDVVYEADVQVEFHMVGPGDELSMTDLKPYAKPCIDRLNAALRDERPLQIYYTVSTDYAGKDHPVSANVPYLVHLRLLEEEFDPTELAQVLVAGLEALGPPAGGASAGDGPPRLRR